MAKGRQHRAAGGVSTAWVSLLCVCSFFLGALIVDRIFKAPVMPEANKNGRSTSLKDPETVINCRNMVLRVSIFKAYEIMKHGHAQAWNWLTISEIFQETSVRAGKILNQVSQTHDAAMTLDKTISDLEMQLSVARASRASTLEKSFDPVVSDTESPKEHPRFFFVMGIITAFSSRKRRDSLRETWMPKGDNLKRLEKEKGIIIRFVIGHSATPGGILDRALNAEEEQHHDFLRLNHVEGYHELSAKTQIYFSTAVSIWDAEFYVKVDDDVHVNLGTVFSTLARHRSRSRAYIGCMKSGPVLAKQGLKYYEPEYWKFGEEGNKYFRHATGQFYAISKDLAIYISVNRHILHRYANEDVSLGSWFLGLDIDHIDERTLCCGTPPDCEWKAQAGNPCAASFDWSCSGICNSAERMEEVHERCGEGVGSIWHSMF